MRRLMTLGMAICIGVTALTGCGGSSMEAATGTQTEQQSQTEKESPEENNSSESGKDAGNTEENTDTRKAASGIDKLVFTYMVSPLSVPSIIEENQETFVKNFEDMGTSVEHAEINSGMDQIQALASGDVRILYTVGATSVILSAINGADIKVLSMYSRSPKALCMYPTDDNLTTSENLEGKTTAGPVGINFHELLAAYLTEGGMTIEDVNYVNMGTPDAKAGLDGGSVDAAPIVEATAYQAKQQGYHMVADGEGLIKAVITVAIRQDFYDANQNVIERLMKAQEEISGFIQDNQGGTLRIVAQELDLEEEAVREMYGYYDFFTEVSDEDRDGFRKTAGFVLEPDVIEETLDVNILFFQQKPISFSKWHGLRSCLQNLSTDLDPGRILLSFPGSLHGCKQTAEYLKSLWISPRMEGAGACTTRFTLQI